MSKNANSPNIGAAASSSSGRNTGTPVGSQVPYDSINSPGAYIQNTTGNLFRIPADAVQPGRSPAMSITSREPQTVTKISDDPFITVTKAAQVCADHDIAQNFL